MKKNDKILFLIEFLLLTLLGVSHVIDKPIISIIIILLLLFLFSLSTTDKCFLMLFVALPFFNLFNTNIGLTSYYYIFIIVFIIKYLTFKKFKIEKNKILLLVLVSLVRLPSGDLLLFLKWFLLFSVLIISYNEKFFIKQLGTIVTLFSISFVISSTIGYYMLNSGISIYTGGYVYTSGIGSTTRFAGLIGDPVFYGQFSALLISSCLVINYFSNKQNILRYALIIIMLIFTFFSYSKTGLILSIFSILVFFISMIIKNAKNKKTMIYSILILMFVIALIYFSFIYIVNNSNNLIIKNFSTRFSSTDLLTGRNEISLHYINMLKNSWKTPFFAMLQSDYSKLFYTSSGNLINRTHNIYIETICAFGLIVSFMFIYFIIKKVIVKIKQKENKIVILPMIIMLLSGFSLHGHFEFQYYFLIAISFAFLNSDIEYELNKEKVSIIERG